MGIRKMLTTVGLIATFGLCAGEIVPAVTPVPDERNLRAIQMDSLFGVTLPAIRNVSPKTEAMDSMAESTTKRRRRHRTTTDVGDDDEEEGDLEDEFEDDDGGDDEGDLVDDEEGADDGEEDEDADEEPSFNWDLDFNVRSSSKVRYL